MASAAPELARLPDRMASEDACATRIIGAAIEVPRHLGPGLLESAYERALHHELQLRGARALRQIQLPAMYKGVELGDAYRVDMLVDGLVVVEIKAVDRAAAIHQVQVLTYLRLMQKRLGLILNFHERLMRDGIIRVINDPDRSASEASRPGGDD